MVFGSGHGRKTSTDVVVTVRRNVVPVGVPRPGIASVVPVATQDDGAPIKTVYSLALFCLLIQLPSIAPTSPTKA